MDVNKILAELREEKQRVEDAIRALEAASMNGGKRRGRPPKWIKDARENAPKKSSS